MNNRVRLKRPHHMDLMHFIILVLVQAADKMMAVCFLIEVPCGQMSKTEQLMLRQSWSVLYSCATEEGPFGAETFCLLVIKKCTMCLTSDLPQ